MAAGLARLGTVVKEIREEHPEVIVVAPVRLSPTVRTTQVAVAALQAIGVDGVAMEGAAAGGEVAKIVEESQLPLIGFCVQDGTPGCRVVKAGERRVALVGLPADLDVSEALTVRERLEKVRAEVDAVVALSLGPWERDRQLAEAGTLEGLVEVVIEGRSGAQAPAPETVRGTTLIRGPATSREVQIISLGSPASSEGRPFGDAVEPDGAVQDAVAQVLARAEGVAERERRAATVVGADVGYGLAHECAACHEAIYDAWTEEPHARALETLRAERKADDVSCLPCHSEYYRRTQLVPAASMEAEGVECASCHGDGLLHGLTGRAELIPKAVGEESCRECHTPERSPGFAYGTYRSKLAH